MAVIPRIPYLQVRNNCLLYYEVPTTSPAKGNPNLVNLNKYTGTMSTGASSRIKKAVDILLQLSPERIVYNPITLKYFPFTINFITLTISCRRNIGLVEGYQKMLMPYLRKMKRHGMKTYIWKAEFQKRGQLHYHITSNFFINWSLIRNEWNNLQRSNGYLNEYARVNRHYDANSTDVHSVYKVRDIGAYLAKYLAKGEGRKVLPPRGSGNGKVWDCSRNLKRKRFSFILGNAQEIRISDLIDKGKMEMIELEHCVIFRMKDHKNILTPAQQALYKSWLQ